MSFITKFNDLSREDLYSVINQMKRQINCLETDLIKTQLFLKSYEKYFDYFNEINERISSNDEILSLIKRIKDIKHLNKNSLQCFVGVMKWSENDLNHSNIGEIQDFGEKNGVFAQTKDNNNLIFNTNNTSDKNYFKRYSKTYSKQNIRENIESNDVFTQTGNIGHISDTIDISDKTLKNENQNNEEVIHKTNEIIFEDNTSLISNCDSINNELEDNDNNDSDFIANEHQISDNSDEEECNESETEFDFKNGFKKKSNFNSKSVFRCNIKGCSSVFKCRKSLSKHKNIHSGKYSCDVKGCNHKAGYNSDLNIHKKRIHSIELPVTQKPRKCLTKSNETEFRCDYEGCPLIFKNQNTFWYHMARHNNKFCCNFNGCHFKCGSNYHLSRHRNTVHSNETPFKCTQKDCDRKFKTRENLRVHLKSHPITDDIVFVCEHSNCGKVFRLKYAFEKHKTTHSLEYCAEKFLTQPVVCDHIGCGKQLRNKDSLNKHKKRHLGLVFHCQWEGCSQSFQLKEHLNKHLIQHKGIYRCNWIGCPFNGSSQTSLNKHIETHSKDTPFKCPFDGCDKQFRTDKHLSSHKIRVHPNEFNDIPWIECQETDCSYKTKCHNAIIKHKRKVHSGPHHCQWFGCDKVYRDSEQLTEHMNIHTGEKIFSCDWPGCDKTFLLSSSLRAHTRYTHKRKFYQCQFCEFRTKSIYQRDIHLKKHEN